MNAPTDLLDCIEIETAPNPTHAVIWLHGLGADGNDFAPIVPELDLPAGLGVRFVFPNAPVQRVTINNGMAMRSWYDILVMDLVRVEDAKGIRASEAAIHKLIARENARGIPTSNIVLAGFSQGCAMTLHTGLRLRDKLALAMIEASARATCRCWPAPRPSARRPTSAPRSSWPTACMTRWCRCRAPRPREPSWNAWATTCAGTPTPCRTRSAPRKWPTSRAF